MDIFINHINFNLNHHNECSKLYCLCNLLLFELVQKCQHHQLCQHCQLCVLREHSIEFVHTSQNMAYSLTFLGREFEMLKVRNIYFNISDNRYYDVNWCMYHYKSRIIKHRIVFFLMLSKVCYTRCPFTSLSKLEDLLHWLGSFVHENYSILILQQDRQSFVTWVW